MTDPLCLWDRRSPFAVTVQCHAYSTGFKLIEKINATETQPQRNRNAPFQSILRYLRTLYIVWSLGRYFGAWGDAELFGVSPGSKLCTAFFNIAKNVEIMSKNQFTGTATQPQRNRKTTANFVNVIMTSTVYLR